MGLRQTYAIATSHGSDGMKTETSIQANPTAITLSDTERVDDATTLTRIQHFNDERTGWSGMASWSWHRLGSGKWSPAIITFVDETTDTLCVRTSEFTVAHGNASIASKKLG